MFKYYLDELRLQRVKYVIGKHVDLSWQSKCVQQGIMHEVWLPEMCPRVVALTLDRRGTLRDRRDGTSC
jgi:hypothetical protein